MTTDSSESGDRKPVGGQSFVTVALDAMSGDLGAETAVQAAQSAVKHNDDLKIILVGDETVLSSLLAKSNPNLSSDGQSPDGQSLADRLSVHHASEVVTMEESAAVAMRSKKDSSMRVAINLVHEGCLLYTSPSPRDKRQSRMPSSA